MRIKYLRTQLVLVIAGIGLGLIARSIFGPASPEDQNQFLTPSPVIDRFDPYNDETEDLLRDPDSIESPESTQSGNTAPVARHDGGLVPPINLTSHMSSGFDEAHRHNSHSHQSNHSSQSGHDPSSHSDSWDHGEAAEFEPHGEQLCASGCALSRHPTRELVAARFHELMTAYTGGGPGEFEALEELLYFGPQTQRMIQAHGCSGLDSDRREFLLKQLEATHALISIRVVDEHGEVRTWVDATRVPLDRRHVFSMETKNLQPLVTSGTVKRVGLDHLWVRL
ncbi:MAG: hypothetical protein AAF456_18185 [Planctomycetota bacterium]